MTIVQQQLEDLAAKYPGTNWNVIPDGSITVAVPNVGLPPGWTLSNATVRFIVPVGYPFSRPDCFWTDHNLRLADNRVPQSTGPNAMPNGPSPLLWFSWHVDRWSPNFDSLLTYLHVIERRFKELK